jgi:LPS-assembly protein
MFPVRRKLTAAVAAVLATLATARIASADELTLKLARDLSTSAPKAPVTTPGRPATSPLLRSEPSSENATQGAIFLRADRLFGDEQTITAEGTVELRGQRETVLADWLSYDVPGEKITAKGDVLLRRGYDWITGPELEYKRDTQTGSFKSPRFVVTEANGRGDAAEIRFVGPDAYEATAATFTTCVAPRPDWYIKSDELEIDTLRMVGTAHDAHVYFLNVPMLYAPRFEFPLSNQRKSGFLTPVLGSSNVRGFEVLTPYYLNLAPNYDATLIPRGMTKRGFMLGGQFRYLLGDDQAPLGTATGQVDGEYLAHDRVTGDDRWAIAFRHNQQFSTWLNGYVNVNEVSDSNYFADFADRVAITSQTVLPREAGITASSGPWSLLTQVQTFQTLATQGQTVTPPYNRLPHLLGSLQDTDWLGLTFSGIADFARFAQPALMPTGDRYVLYPSVAWNQQGAAWFFTARASVHMRQYDLNSVTPPIESNPGVVVPITSIDTGLVFERPFDFAGRALTQTLEPRLFYVYIPFRQQNQTPIFDSALDDFNFSQLFTENRYLGNDRIGDANQLSIALTSRFIDDATGAERLRVAVGQRYYFSSPQVTLSGPPSVQAGKSDFLLGADGKLSDAWAMSSLFQYNFTLSQVDRFNAGVRFTPTPGRALNATWRYTRQGVDPLNPDEIKQIDLSGQWPVSDRWTLLGRWNYSIVDHKTLEGVAGFEYNADCWVLRIVAQRLTTTTQQTSSSVFVQLEFNGLARVGTSPLELLRRSIPGYLRTNDPSLRARDRSYDPLPEF